MDEPVKISIASLDQEMYAEVQAGLEGRGFEVSCVQNAGVLLGRFYSDPPEVMLLDCISDPAAAEFFVNTLRNDIFFSTMPVIGLLSHIDGELRDWGKLALDDFIAVPFSPDELVQRITLSIARIKRVFDNNPLTRLPGNSSIQRTIKEAIGKPMAVCYLDINQFKPYNDVYGFTHGDEVIRMLSRIMYNAVRENGGGFCGHIGGDDFVCVVPVENAEVISKTIIANYDKIVLDLFDEQIRQQGYYVSVNRKGETEQIPLLSLSIAIVPTDKAHVTHFARVAEVAAELKALAKLAGKSSYIMDKRRH